jgi:acyloxyacyl hydrolase
MIRKRDAGRATVKREMFLLFVAGACAFFSREWVEEALLRAPAGGGIGCAACTIVTSIVEQLSVLHNKPVEDVMDLLCEWLPVGPQETCLYLVAMYGADITKFLESGLNADEACHGLQLCTDPTCLMYPPTGKPVGAPSTPLNRQDKRQASIWQWLQNLLLAVANHEPDADFDGDLFASDPVLRGYNFRGQDCDNFDASVHAGRRTGVAGQDYDCNGIDGFNPQTMQPYKDELCAGTPHIGVVAIGDSAGAHFSIPPRYMNASEIGPDTYDDLLWVLADEIDHPHIGGYTGFINSTKAVPVDSLYKRMRERNRCLHRDYQVSRCVSE